MRAFLFAIFWAVQAQAGPDIPNADIYVLGEVHDNPAHHRVQAEWVSVLAPKAVVFEMLRRDEAAKLMDAPRDTGGLRTALEGAHWSNIADYLPIMLAADAPLLGAAASPYQVRAAFAQGAAALFGAEADRYGLTRPLPEAQLAAREAMQFDAHCKAMPLEMMGGMVEAQRFRDAVFARVVLDALEEHGAPVVLITGNGHARRDWGVPSYVQAAAPDTLVFALGQSEAGGTLAGGFDRILDAPAPERGDPCAAFAK